MLIEEGLQALLRERRAQGRLSVRLNLYRYTQGVDNWLSVGQGLHQDHEGHASGYPLCF